jgi:hypothetical protein
MDLALTTLIIESEDYLREPYYRYTSRSYHVCPKFTSLQGSGTKVANRSTPHGICGVQHTDLVTQVDRPVMIEVLLRSVSAASGCGRRSAVESGGSGGTWSNGSGDMSNGGGVEDGGALARGGR